MDQARFDLATRLLGRTGNRRSLAAVAAALVAGGTAENGAAARRNRCLRHGRRCGKKSGQKDVRCAKCCSDFALHTSDALIPTGRRRCGCRPDGMPCGKDAHCCNGVCNPATMLCDDGLPADPPVACDFSVNFCQGGAPNCGSTTKCWCVNTNSQENFCTNGQFSCASNFGNNITCQSDNDCFNRYGETTACVSTSGCGSSVPCSGGTICAQICPI